MKIGKIALIFDFGFFVSRRFELTDFGVNYKTLDLHSKVTVGNFYPIHSPVFA